MIFFQNIFVFYFQSRSLSESRSGTLRFSKHPSPVLVVAYQRTGSTFLAGMFSNHPDTFMWFEPLDGVYSTLYGVGQGWSVPIDLYAYNNGSNR